MAVQVEAGRKRWHLCALLCGITLIVYANSFGLDLTTDAYAIVHTEPRVQQLSAENINLIFTRDYWWPSPADNLYRPITLLSYLFNYAILGDRESPAGYHFLNFVLHALNVCLLFLLAERLLRNRMAGLFAAAIWAVHPIVTESVTNVSGRADLLAGSAVMGCLVLHASSVHWTGRRRHLALLGVFSLTLLGGLSKESALILPGLLLLWDTLDLKQWKENLRTRVPAYAAGAAALGLIYLLRFQALGSRPWPKQPYLENPLITVDFWTARLTAVKTLGMELWLLFFPVNLSSDRSWRQIPFAGWGDAGLWMSLAAIIAIIAIALLRYPRDRAIYFAVGFVGIALLPSSNLLILIGSIMAERFLYLPAAGFAIAVAALAFRLKRPKAPQAVLAALLVLYAGRTYARNFDWHDNLSLNSADVFTSPQSYRLHDMLGRGLFVRNSGANIDRSIQEGEAAWEILRHLPPEWVPDVSLYHLGLYYGTKGQMLGGESTAQGREWYEKAIAILVRAREVSVAAERNFDRLQREHGKPVADRQGYQPLFKTLGLVYSRMARHAEALEALRAGRSLNPETAEFYPLMAHEYQVLGKADWAGIAMIENAEIQPMTPAVVNGLREVLGPVPEASCAVSQQGAVTTLNYGCPWLRANTCLALDDLAQAFTEARRAARAAELRSKAVTQFGCPAK